ncbi:CrcB family protein [Microbacterium proteolyticum]|uniref:CrcB family protein n=1 Tax=Microbacterium proteolyticum TaxID=1572644 RepID=UPI0024180ED1|nr:CrcB family protein [Microbacterium proteolyticum]
MTTGQRDHRADSAVTRALLVFLGGSLGTAIRLMLGTIVMGPGASILATVAVDVTGAALLGILYGLTPPGDARSARRRLLLGTGLLGGYTTYGTLVVDADGLVLAHDPWAGALVASATLALGVAAAFVGERAATRARERARA